MLMTTTPMRNWYLKPKQCESLLKSHNGPFVPVGEKNKWNRAPVHSALTVNVSSAW